MVNDDFMNANTYSGAGDSKPAPVVISKTNNILNSVYCDMSEYPGFVQNYTINYNYEAYFTGDLNLTVLDNNVINMNSKLVGYLGSSSGLCDGLECNANTVNCVAHNTKSKVDKALMGVTKKTADVLRTTYLCEQPKPLKQLPYFNRFACVPVSGSLTVSLSNTLNQTAVETAVFQMIQQGMDTGDLNTPNQIIGLVYAPKASTTINSSGKIQKKMRPIGIGFLTAGLIVLVAMVITIIACHLKKKRDNNKEYVEDEDDDLSLEKDKEDEESNVLTVSYMSDDSTPVKGSSRK